MSMSKDDSSGQREGNAFGQNLFLAIAVVGSLVLVGYLVIFHRPGNGVAKPPTPVSLQQIPFDGAAAFTWIPKLCQLGSRASGTSGMLEQQTLLEKHFQSLGGQVERQSFAIRHPQNGSSVPMTNLIIRWHPERKDRILLCAHYDTRPFPDQDPSPQGRRGLFVGANDGASGVAVLAEMGRHMKSLPEPLGVDFALFDGEEFCFSEEDRYFLGSEFFAREYAAQTDRPYQYRAAVLLDMVGDEHLALSQDISSLQWTDSRWIVKSIWSKAADLGVREFIARPMRVQIRDDHIPLHDIGVIPACDIIDFFYLSADRAKNYWHTREDTPDKCSAESLAKVGWVVWEWLKDQAAAGNKVTP